MIQLIINLAKIIVISLIALLFGSCKYDINLGESITGSGHVISKERKVAPFDKISVSRGLECEVSQADKASVVVVADDNLQEGIKTTVENGTLEITSIYGNYHNVKSKKIIVQLPYISSLETSSGSDLITRNIIKSNEITLKSSSGSKLEAEVASEKISCESSSGSTQKIEGKAISLQTTSSSGSHIDAERLLANEVDAKSSSGSSTSVNPVLSLKARASSGSNIQYKKRPKTLTVDQSSGGSVEED
jgi:hypothetical protein